MLETRATGGVEDMTRRGTPEPVPDPLRLDVLRSMHDGLALQTASCEALERTVWRMAALFYESGTPLEDLCEAMGVAAPTFYRRLREVRGLDR